MTIVSGCFELGPVMNAGEAGADARDPAPAGASVVELALAAPTAATDTATTKSAILPRSSMVGPPCPVGRMSPIETKDTRRRASIPRPSTEKKAERPAALLTRDRGESAICRPPRNSPVSRAFPVAGLSAAFFSTTRRTASDLAYEPVHLARNARGAGVESPPPRNSSHVVFTLPL